MEEKIIEIFRYHTGNNYNEIITSATFEDLGLDSLDCVEICMDIEDQFAILIDDSELNSLKTLLDVFNLVRAKTTPATPPETVKDDTVRN